jgi:hypothetical protein
MIEPLANDLEFPFFEVFRKEDIMSRDEALNWKKVFLSLWLVSLPSSGIVLVNVNGLWKGIGLTLIFSVPITILFTILFALWLLIWIPTVGVLLFTIFRGIKEYLSEIKEPVVRFARSYYNWLFEDKWR